MGWNNANERRKFEERQKRLAIEYRANGMTDKQIEEMYQFDLRQFNSNRRYREHTQAFQVDEFDDADESDNSLMRYFPEQLTSKIDDLASKTRFGWVEEIEDERLYKILIGMSKDDIELITLYVFDGYTQDEIANYMNCTKQNIQKKFHRIKKHLK